MNREKQSSKNSAEFQSFDRTMRELVSVPHGEIKAKLEAEKKQKIKKKRKIKASASGRAGDEKG